MWYRMGYMRILQGRHMRCSLCRHSFLLSHCYKDLTDKDFIGEWELPGDALHAPGKFWVFQHTDNTCCEKWSRCHVSTENSFVEAWKEIKEQRETMANEEKSLPDAQ